MTTFIVQTAAAQMPASCWGAYRRVAVLEVEDDLTRVGMISPRARGVVRIVETWEKCNVGRTERGSYQRALRAANELRCWLLVRRTRVPTVASMLVLGDLLAEMLDAAATHPVKS